MTRPQFSSIDAWGLTHPGLQRPDNQDHFFLGALAQGVNVEATSVAELDEPVLHVDRLASLGIVADGVGGADGGEEAARTAVRELVAAVSRFFPHAEFAESQDPDVFSRLLHEAALECHEALLKKSEGEGQGRRFATTLTLFLGLWPHAYLLQLGDSRCYVFREGRLTQISQDQTLAQELIDSGVLSRMQAEGTRWADILSSSMGGPEATPVVTRFVREWGTVVLLCSDGLTKHVSDARIEEVLATMTDSRQAAELLLQDALEHGGSDNITVLVGRTVRPG
jgi:protein phosphatase